jgi:flagella basal body P-ring formation protein FlgA
MEHLDPGEVRAAMLTTLQSVPGVRDIQVNIVELSLSAVPVGKSVFPLETLGSSQTQGAPALWKGYVEYAGGKRWNIWARVNVKTVYDRVVATASLERGRRIQAGDIKIEAADGIPSASLSVQEASEVIDRELKWTVAAGQPIPPRALQTPNEVTAGQIIKVNVRSAAARLSMEARAESAGKRGDYVLVRNLESKKAFRARVAGVGRAEVDVESR